MCVDGCRSPREEEETPEDSGYSAVYSRPASLRSDYGDLNRAPSPVPAYRVDTPPPPAYQHAGGCHTPPPPPDYRLAEEGTAYSLLHHTSSSSSPALAIYQHSQHSQHNQQHHHADSSNFASDSPGEDGSYPPANSPPPSLFRLTCSPVHLGPPPPQLISSGHSDADNSVNSASEAGPQFTALVGSSLNPSADKGGGGDPTTATAATTTATFRLSDLAESGYRLDLQSGQLQIHLDLSTGDVLNLSGVVSEAEAGSSPLLEAGETSAAYLQPAYYDMSGTVATSMDDTETAAAHSAYTAYFNSSSSGGGAVGGAALSMNSSSSPYALTNRYSDLYSPYYQSGYSWAGAQTSAGTGTFSFI